VTPLNSILLKHNDYAPNLLKRVLTTTPLGSKRKADWIYSNVVVTLIEQLQVHLCSNYKLVYLKDILISKIKQGSKQ